MQRFIEVLTEDSNVREDFIKQDTPEGAYRVAKPYINEMTIEEFTDNLIRLGDALNELQLNELDAEDLNTVSGGTGKFSDQMKKVGSKFVDLAYQYGPGLCSALGSFLTKRKDSSKSETLVKTDDLD